MKTSTLAKFAKVLLLSLACGVLAWPLFSQYAKDSFDVKAHYEKHEYQIAMRDGVKLFTAVYVPRDNSEDHPILLSRTPYSVGPYGADAYRDSLYPGNSPGRITFSLCRMFADATNPKVTSST